jgi:hypothetical protein
MPRETYDPDTCPHPPVRMYCSWVEDALHDGACVTCCACGSVLQHPAHRSDAMARECASLQRASSALPALGE